MTCFWSYGLENANFEVLAKMTSQLGFWWELGIKMSLSILGMSYGLCGSRFHDQIAAGLVFGNYRSLLHKHENYRSWLIFGWTLAEILGMI